MPDDDEVARRQREAEFLMLMANADPSVINIEALQTALGDYLKQKSSYYQRKPRQETPGGAYFYGMGSETGAEKGKPDEGIKAGYRNHDDHWRDAFAYGFSASKGGRRVPPEDFHRSLRDPVVMQRLRDLKAMRDGTEYEGERENAQSAMDRIMAKHGIDATEI